MRKLLKHIFARRRVPYTDKPEVATDSRNPIHNQQLYLNLLNHFRQEGYTETEALNLTIGGHFHAFGILERDLLIQYGLKPEQYLIDVGCGSGRLAYALREYLIGRYLGLDVLPELLDQARSIVSRSDWFFKHIQGFNIPEQNDAADYICFFSVFTHLLHEQSYVYLRDAKRVIKQGGFILFSFMEYGYESHWQAFENAVAQINDNLPLNVFISRDAIEAWASHLDLKIVAIHNGEEPFIVLREPAIFDHGGAFTEYGTIGQSVCVLQKP